MHIESLKKKVENDIIKKNIGQKNNEENVILFVSFDLVNSTRFKNYNNFWLMAINDITTAIRNGVSGISPYFQLWRTIGDELVFTIVVRKKEKLYFLVQEVFKVLNIIYNELKEGSIFQSLDPYQKEQVINQNIISIKGTAWIALVSGTENQNATNVKYEYTPKFANERGLSKIIEFQGNDIDIGFRIAKACTNSRRLALSLELGYILAQSKHIAPKINIIGYEKLKGVWNGNLYPIIWYHDEYEYGSSFKDSFFYTEILDDEFEKHYLQYNKKNLEHNICLEKIIQDRNLKYKIGKICDNFISEEGDGDGLDAPLEAEPELIEIHCVAVCINKENKVFMVKRSHTQKSYAGLWEFGCSKMVSQKSFKEILEKEYKRNFNIEIEVKDPFVDYTFTKNDKKISGIRYKADIINDENISLNLSKYCEYKFMDYEEFMKMKEEEFISFGQFEPIVKMVSEGRKVLNE